MIEHTHHAEPTPKPGLWASAKEALARFAPTKRMVVATSGLLSAAVIGMAGLNVASSYVTVMVEVDGVLRPHSGFASSVSTVLNDLDIPVRSADHVAPGLNESVYDGDRIVVRHARSVNVEINGQTTTIDTTADSMEAVMSALATRGDVHVAANRSAQRDEDLPLVSRTQQVPVKFADETVTITLTPSGNVRVILAEAGHPLGPLDRVKARVHNGALAITVERVTRGVVTENSPVPFKESTVDSADLFQGESVVTTRGVDGVLTKSYWQETVDGNILHRELHGEAITTAPVDQVRAKGTKEVTTLELLKAGIDPKAQLEDGTEEDGRPSTRFRATAGTLSSDAEIAQLRSEAQLSDIPLVYSGEDPKNIAQGLVAARGWGDGEFRCLVALWQRESNWNPYAENPSSGAYGIPQSLPGSKMGSVAPDWRTNPVTQITWGLNYIAGRYGTPCSAWGHSESVGWY